MASELGMRLRCRGTVCTLRAQGVRIEPDVRRHALAALVAACRDTHDPSCFELFRRAVAERDHAAWAAVMAQYAGLVRAWVRRHPSSAALAPHEREEDWPTAAFGRFWAAIAPERFGHFSGLAPLLQYLKMCAHSALMDVLRARAAAQIGDDSASIADAEAVAVERLAASDLWHAVGAALSDDDERLVARLSFVLDLKPAEIYERYPARFASVADVYRIKRNILERLRRNETIRALANLPADHPEAAAPAEEVTR